MLDDSMSCYGISYYVIYSSVFVDSGASASVSLPEWLRG